MKRRSSNNKFSVEKAKQLLVEGTKSTPEDVEYCVESLAKFLDKALSVSRWLDLGRMVKDLIKLNEDNTEFEIKTRHILNRMQSWDVRCVC